MACPYFYMKILRLRKFFELPILDETTLKIMETELKKALTLTSATKTPKKSELKSLVISDFLYEDAVELSRRPVKSKPL